jgi:hypothetical protein
VHFLFHYVNTQAPLPPLPQSRQSGRHELQKQPYRPVMATRRNYKHKTISTREASEPAPCEIVLSLNQHIACPRQRQRRQHSHCINSELGSKTLIPPTITWVITHIKVRLTLYLTQYHAIEMYSVLNSSTTPWWTWGSGSIAPCVLTSALDGSEWSVARPVRFIPGEGSSGTRWTGGWVVPRTGLDAVAKRKIPFPYRESNLGHQVRSLVTILTKISRIQWYTHTQLKAIRETCPYFCIFVSQRSH